MTIEIIAEIAQGFEGKPEQSVLLLTAAAKAGANAAKYQVVYADELATPDYEHFTLFRALEMPDAVWTGLGKLAVESGIELHLDIFGERSLELAQRCSASAIKLHGTDIANIGLLRSVSESSIARVLLGAGGANSEEISRALSILGGKQVCVLLGFQGYPTPNEANQIARVRLMIERLGKSLPQVSVGFADHAPPESPLRFVLAAAAIGAGARVIEKHITLARVMQLEDHESALNPDQFLEFVQVIRDCELAVGQTMNTDDFGMTPAELEYRRKIRRHVVTGRILSAGTILGEKDLVLKRTGNPTPLTEISACYRRTLGRDIDANVGLNSQDFL